MLLAFAFSVGTIALVVFRLLGLGMRRESAAEIAKDLAPWAGVIFGGILIAFI